MNLESPARRHRTLHGSSTSFDAPRQNACPNKARAGSPSTKSLSLSCQQHEAELHWQWSAIHNAPPVHDLVALPPSSVLVANGNCLEPCSGLGTHALPPAASTAALRHNGRAAAASSHQRSGSLVRRGRRPGRLRNRFHPRLVPLSTRSTSGGMSSARDKGLKTRAAKTGEAIIPRPRPRWAPSPA